MNTQFFKNENGAFFNWSLCRESGLYINGVNTAWRLDRCFPIILKCYKNSKVLSGIFLCASNEYCHGLIYIIFFLHVLDLRRFFADSFPHRAKLKYESCLFSAGNLVQHNILSTARVFQFQFCARVQRHPAGNSQHRRRQIYEYIHIFTSKEIHTTELCCRSARLDVRNCAFSSTAATPSVGDNFRRDLKCKWKLQSNNTQSAASLPLGSSGKKESSNSQSLFINQSGGDWRLLRRLSEKDERERKSGQSLQKC